MPRQKKPDQPPEREVYEIGGRQVEIRRVEGREQVWIDGRRHKVLVSDDGYNLYGDAYSLPKPTLQEAIAEYLRKYPGGQGPRKGGAA